MKYGLAVCARCGHINPEFNKKCFHCGTLGDYDFDTQGHVTVKADVVIDPYEFLAKENHGYKLELTEEERILWDRGDTITFDINRLKRVEK